MGDLCPEVAIFASCLPHISRLNSSATAERVIRSISLQHLAFGDPVSTFVAHLQSLLAGLSLVDLMGAAGIALGSTWALFRRRRTILACQALGSLSFCAHYILLGAPTAAIACSMSLLQSVAGYSGKRPAWLGPFYVATYLVVLGGAVLTWHGAPSLCVAFAAMFAAIGRWQMSPQRMRLVFLFCSCCWVVHNTLAGSYFGLTSDAIALSTMSVGLWRNRRRSPLEAAREAASIAAEACRSGLAAVIGMRRSMAG